MGSWSIFLSFAIWLTVSAPAQESFRPNSPSPLWSMRLPYDPRILPEDDVYPRYVDKRNGVTFLDNQKLLVHEVVREAPQLSSREGPAISSPFRMRMYVFDINSTKLPLTMQWGTRAHESSIDATSEGLVVHTGEILRFFSVELTERSEMVLKEMAGQGDNHWSEAIISVSPSRKTFMINRFNQKSNVSRLDVFDGETFQAKYSWMQSPPLYHSYSISDQAIAAVRMPEQKGIVYSEFASHEWRPLARTSDGACDLLTSFVGLLTFISNERLMIGTGGQTCISDVEGRSEAISNFHRPAMCSDQAPFGEKVTTSRDGRFIAMSLAQIETKTHILTEPSQKLVRECVQVYDLSTRKWTLTVDLVPLPKNDYDFALSPDGSRLAVVNDRTLNVYSIQTSE